GSCWRSGCRCRWAARAASRCRCCSGCTSAPSVAAPRTPLADRVRLLRRLLAAEQAHAAHPRPTKLALARDLLALVADWAEGRTVYAVVDSAYAARPLLEGRPANVHVLSRLRPDAALWARPGRRRPGQRGRPRKRGHRPPT